MTPDAQLAECAAFFDRAYQIMSGGKATDYAPEGHIFIDVFLAGADNGLHPEEVFLVHVRKQMAAIRRWARYRTLATESVESRLGDVVNYMAFLHIMNLHGTEVAEGVLDVAESWHCDNHRSGVAECLVSDDPCDRCRLIDYTRKYLIARRSNAPEASQRQTQKAQG